MQIIGEHVNLKRTGSDYRGPCPFHQGKDRNFSVAPKKGIYYCFVCHASGDAIDFAKEWLGLDFTEAVKHVAARSGVEVRETERKRDEPDQHDPLREANTAAASFFRDMLWDEKIGGAAREYLTQRRVSREVADTFELGFAPEDPAALRRHLNVLGFADEQLLEAGLLYRQEGSDEIRARFRNRLMFPIFDALGRCVGFGGRKLGAGEPKYLNSAESPIFSKGRLLYGLHRAKHAIRREDRVLVVEGYFDAVRLVSVGIEPVVAPLGTALTEAQAALLRRFTRNAFLLYDGDKPGLKATFRAGDELLRHGFAVQVVTLPEGDDPDSFADKHGRDAVVAQIGSAIDVFERKVQILQRAGAFADLQKKRRAVNLLLDAIRATSDALMREIYLTRASEVSGVSKELLQREIRDAGPRVAPSSRAAKEPVPSPPGRKGKGRNVDPPRTLESGELAERDLVSVMILYPSKIESIAERVGPERFRVDRYREIFERLLACFPDTSAENLSNELSEQSIQALQEALAHPDAVANVEPTIDHALNKLLTRDIYEELEKTDRRIEVAVKEQNDELVTELMIKKMGLVAEMTPMKGISRRVGKSR